MATRRFQLNPGNPLERGVARVDSMRDGGNDHSGIPLPSGEAFEQAAARWSRLKRQLTIGLGEDVPDWREPEDWICQALVKRILRAAAAAASSRRAN